LTTNWYHSPHGLTVDFRELSKIETLKDFYVEFLDDPKTLKNPELLDIQNKIITVMVWYIEDFFTFNKGKFFCKNSSPG